MRSVAIVITVYRKPERLARLLDNMRWSGIPDVPVYVFEDPSPFSDREAITSAYTDVCREKHVRFQSAPKWGCMQGSIQYAFANTTEDWLIYVPDDVLFTRGALWNEYAGILTYGRPFVGGIQAPFWNAHELVDMGILSHREKMNQGWLPDGVPRNPHWDYPGVPRAYINLNGAGFSLSRALFVKMGGWPMCTWRLDEWAGYQSWKHGMVCITLPGPPRIHYFGATTPDHPEGLDFASVAGWKEATGGFTPTEAGIETERIMSQLPGGTWDELLTFFTRKQETNSVDKEELPFYD